MCLILVLVVISVVVVRGSTLPVPAAVSEIDQDFLEPGTSCLLTSTMAWSEGGYWDHAAVYVEDPYPSVVGGHLQPWNKPDSAGEFLQGICQPKSR